MIFGGGCHVGKSERTATILTAFAPIKLKGISLSCKMLVIVLEKGMYMPLREAGNRPKVSSAKSWLWLLPGLLK